MCRKCALYVFPTFAKFCYMPVIAGRDCSAEVAADAPVCPQCVAPRPARREWHGEGFEWKSRRTWMGWPLVHIAFGKGSDGRPRVARGVIAIGQRAIGGLA